MNENNIRLQFNYDDTSYAIYEQNYNEQFTNHERELFCNNNFNSNFFMKYRILESESTSKYKYSFPFPTYGLLDTFWAEQTNLQLEDKLYLKLKWIHQLTEGIKELHAHNYYYGQLSSQCISIDDKKNMKFSFLSNPLEPPKTSTIENSTYFYMPPEYYNDSNAFDIDLAKHQSYDIYALGIIINGIIKEKFPHRDDFPDLKKEQVLNMLKNPKINNYPQKNLVDPFWNEINTQIIDACLRTDNRPTIFEISKNLEQILQEKAINNTYIYNIKPEPIMQSSQDQNYNITSLIRKLINFNDISYVLNKLQTKYGDLSFFFKEELLFASPFKSYINGFDIPVMFTPKQINDEKNDIVFKSMPNPYFKEYFEDDIKEDENIYSEITESEYDIIEKEHQESYTISNFFYNNFYFCNLKQFLNLYHNDGFGKIKIGSEDIISWFIYISEYMIRLEAEQKDKPFLPHNFSSETVLISLLADSKGGRQFQLSIFPFPTKETEISKIYAIDNSDDIDSDIYSFGVLMFEILSLLTYTDEKSIDFDSEVTNSLFTKFHNLDPSFNIINTRRLQNIMKLIKDCLTPGNQPSFTQIKSSLCDIQNPIIDGINTINCIENYEYCLRNQCMNLIRLASLNHLFAEDEVHSIILKFIKEKTENEYEYEDDDDDDNENNPFQNIFNKVAKAEFDSKFIDPFNFILLLKLKDDELSERIFKKEDNSSICNILNPYINEIKQIKQKLLSSKQEYRDKCLKLKSSKILFKNIAKSSASTALSLIKKTWSPHIPHTLLITVKNNDIPENNTNDNNNNNNNDDDDDDDDDDSQQNNPSGQNVCTLDFLKEFAQNQKIKYKIFSKRNQIKMFFPIQVDIFKELNLGPLGYDILADYHDNFDISEEEEEEFIEEEEEEDNS